MKQLIVGESIGPLGGAAMAMGSPISKLIAERVV
jgi:hypothetical protein